MFRTTPGTVPRAPLAFRVGVTGHRMHRLQHADMAQLGEVVRAILEATKDAAWAFDPDRRYYARPEPVLRAVSPLAEGSDRVFATAALDLGYALCCPMPFPRGEFKADFAPGKAREPDSEKRFEDLLERARRGSKLSIFELDGSRDDVDSAYAAASQVVLNQSDLLLVIWDGRDGVEGDRSVRRGGTEDTFAMARQGGVPVVWIDAQAPHAWQLVGPSDEYVPQRHGERAVPSGGTIDALRKMVHDMLDLPYPQPRASTPRRKGAHARAGKSRRREDPRAYRQELVEALKQFYAERKRRIAFGPMAWTFFRSFIGYGRPGLRSFRIPDFEQEVVAEWRVETFDEALQIPTETAGVVNHLRETLRPYFVWPDALAVRYAQAYRSAFLASYVLAAFAVGAALLPSAFGWLGAPDALLEGGCIVAELALIAVILGLVSWGRARHWQERWIDYRLAAELLRPLGVLALLGGGRPLPQMPAHLATYGSPGGTWMAWYVRAVERFVGLPTVRVDDDHLRACLVVLRQSLEAQLEYHEGNEDQCDRMERHLHRIGLVLLVGTLVGCVAHLLPFVFSIELPANVAPKLVLVGGLFPALGAALAGISNQAEFVRMAKRSEAMAAHLQTILDALPDVRPSSGMEARSSLSLPRVVDLMARASQPMVHEVLDWRIVLLDRPLAPPG